METNEKLIYLQTILGLFLTGEVSNNMFFVFWGEGSNGNTLVIDNIMSKILGNFYTPVSRSVFIKSSDRFTKSNEHTEHLMPLIGARLGVCSESAMGDKLNDVIIKQITGNDVISGRGCGGNPRQFASRPQSSGRSPQCAAGGILRQRFQFGSLCGAPADPARAAGFAPAHPCGEPAAALRGAARSRRRRRRCACLARRDRVAATVAAHPDRRHAADR